MLIAQISDLHIAGPQDLTLGIAPMAENLARCVQNLNALTPKPDLVLLSGDVCHDGLLPEAMRAADILAGLDCPYYLVPGNHDNRDVLWQAFGGGACPAKADGFINFVIEGAPLRVIALDSLVMGAAYGAFCVLRAAWLQARLEEGGDQPTVIFMHHPPLMLGTPETDREPFQGADILGEIVARFPNIERILCGHIHLPSFSRWRGTIVTTAPSMGMQVDLDLTQTHGSRFLLSDPAYMLHHWTAQNVLVSHIVYLRDHPGPHEFG